MAKTPIHYVHGVNEDEVTPISLDVALGIPPCKSRRVKYGPAELAMYDDMKAEFEAARKENPNVVWEHTD